MILLALVLSSPSMAMQALLNKKRGCKKQETWSATLYWYIQCGELESVTKFLANKDNKVYVNVKSTQGNTPLHTVFKSVAFPYDSDEGRKNMLMFAKLLFKAGAKKYPEDGDGKTPFDLASELDECTEKDELLALLKLDNDDINFNEVD